MAWQMLNLGFWGWVAQTPPSILKIWLEAKWAELRARWKRAYALTHT